MNIGTKWFSKLNIFIATNRKDRACTVNTIYIYIKNTLRFQRSAGDKKTRLLGGDFGPFGERSICDTLSGMALSIPWRFFQWELHNYVSNLTKVSVQFLTYPNDLLKLPSNSYLHSHPLPFHIEAIKICNGIICWSFICHVLKTKSSTLLWFVYEYSWRNIWAG